MTNSNTYIPRRTPTKDRGVIFKNGAFDGTGRPASEVREIKDISGYLKKLSPKTLALLKGEDK